MCAVLLLIWAGLIGIILLFQTIRFLVWMFFKCMLWSIPQRTSTTSTPANHSGHSSRLLLHVYNLRMHIVQGQPGFGDKYFPFVIIYIYQINVVSEFNKFIVPLSDTSVKSFGLNHLSCLFVLNHVAVCLFDLYKEYICFSVSIWFCCLKYVLLLVSVTTVKKSYICQGETYFETRFWFHLHKQ